MAFPAPLREVTPSERNFLIHPRTKEEKQAGLTHDDLRAGLKPEDVDLKIRECDPDQSRGGGLFVAVWTCPSGLQKVQALTSEYIQNTKRLPKRVCIHHIGGNSRVTLTKQRIARVKKDHSQSGGKCGCHQAKWKEIAQVCGAYLQ